MRISTQSSSDHVTFGEATRVLCNIEPTLSFLNVVDALKRAIVENQLKPHGVPDLYKSSGSDWVRGIDPQSGCVFHPGGNGFLFRPEFSMRDILMIFADNEEERISAEQKATILIAKERGKLVESQSKEQNENAVFPGKRISDAEMKRFLEGRLADSAGQAPSEAQDSAAYKARYGVDPNREQLRHARNEVYGDLMMKRGRPKKIAE